MFKCTFLDNFFKKQAILDNFELNIDQRRLSLERKNGNLAGKMLVFGLFYLHVGNNEVNLAQVSLLADYFWVICFKRRLNVDHNTPEASGC